MIEAVAAVNDFAFDVLGLDRLILNNAEGNTGSHRVKEKSGATIVAINDDVPYVGGVYRQIRLDADARAVALPPGGILETRLGFDVGPIAGTTWPSCVLQSAEVPFGGDHMRPITKALVTCALAAHGCPGLRGLHHN